MIGLARRGLGGLNALTLLKDRVRNDGSPYVRIELLRELSRFWRGDGQISEMLTHLACKDEHNEVRCAALQELASG